MGTLSQLLTAANGTLLPCRPPRSTRSLMKEEETKNCCILACAAVLQGVRGRQRKCHARKFSTPSRRASSSAHSPRNSRRKSSGGRGGTPRQVFKAGRAGVLSGSQAHHRSCAQH